MSDLLHLAQVAAEQVVKLNEAIAKTELRDVDAEELAVLLDVVSTMKIRALEVDSEVAVALASKMTSSSQVIGGVVLQRSGPTGSTSWDEDGLLDVLVARSRDERRLDQETGEYESEVSAFLRVLKECASIGYFRVGKKEEGSGLRGRGVDPDPWRTKPTGPRKASVIR